MKRFLVGLLLAAAPVPAWASCGSLPVTLSNGTVANADQVMADFNCVAQGTFDGGVETKSGSIGVNRNTSNGAIYDNGRYAFQMQQAGSGSDPSVNNLVMQTYAQNGSFTSNPWSVDGAGRMSVNLGWTNTTWTLYVNGTAAGNSGWAVTSDERLKTNIHDVDHGLDTILQLHPVHFGWKPAAQRAVGTKLQLDPAAPQVGFLAQEVAKVIPEAVKAPEKADQTYSFVPTDIIPFLVQAVKEQQAEIGDLKGLQAEIQDLKNQLASLKARQ